MTSPDLPHPTNPAHPSDPPSPPSPPNGPVSPNSPTPSASSREAILARIRSAPAGRPPAPEPVRDYLTVHPSTADPVDMLAAHLADYRAHVHRTTDRDLPGHIARILHGHQVRSIAVPPGLPAAWLAEAGDVRQQADGEPPLTPRQLDAIDAVVTGCALAVAETGTIVLDAGPGQGRRALTLVPDVHLCVVRVPEQVVASVPQALPRLDPARPQTWISGPSATSDIELSRVEGVHGPRTLHVLLTAAGDPS